MTPIHDDDGTITYQVSYAEADTLSNQLLTLMKDARTDVAIIATATTLARLMSSSQLSQPEEMQLTGLAVTAIGQALNELADQTLH